MKNTDRHNNCKNRNFLFRICGFFRSILESLGFKLKYGRKCRCQECKKLVIEIAETPITYDGNGAYVLQGKTILAARKVLREMEVNFKEFR